MEKVRFRKQERGSKNAKKDSRAIREELYINFVIKVAQALKWMAGFKGAKVMVLGFYGPGFYFWLWHYFQKVHVCVEGTIL